MRLVYIVIGWSVGILLAANNPHSPPSAWFALALAAAVIAWLFRRDSLLRTGFMVLTALMLGGWRIAVVAQSSDVAQYNDLGGLTIEGIVTDAPDIRDDRIQLRVAVESVTRTGYTFPTSGITLVQAPRTSLEIHYGDRISATGLLITPAEYDTFSYADFLARSGVFSIMSNAAVEILSTGHGNALYGWLLDLKRLAATAIARGLPEPHAGLLSGILLGEDRGISQGLVDDFSAVGASHIVAISGFNMSIVSATVMGLFRKMRVGDRAAAIFGISALLIYTIFVGASASVLRAAIMSSLLIIAPLLKRKTYVPTSLAFVALVMSALNPTVLYDIGFQLTFFATLGLALFVDPLSKRFEALLYRLFPRRIANTTTNLLAEPLIVTIAASIMTLPLIAIYFNRLSLVMLPVNLLVVPVQAVLLLLGLAATLVAMIVPLLGQILYWLVLPLLAWTIDVVRLFARLPFADVEIHADPRLVAFFFIGVLGWAMTQATQPAWLPKLTRFVKQRAIVTATAFSGLLIFVLVGAVYLSRPDGHLHVWFLDVGHSNAVLIQTPGGAHILVDGGRFPSRLLTAIGDRLPFTDRTLEVLILTQPDEYEFGALPIVLSRYTVDLALSNGQTSGSQAFVDLELALSNSQNLIVGTGNTVEISDGVTIQVLYPPMQPQLGDSFDDNTLVLRLSYGDVSFLLTSDLSREGQEALVESGELLTSTVLQLPQHGTGRSLSGAFVEAVQPSAVVLQSARDNRRGDPDADVLAMVESLPLLRTDQSGTLHLWTDGTRLWAVADG
ncbi:MAG: ComEC/Rec2 family competence protein [Anaerolineae bacterium]